MIFKQNWEKTQLQYDIPLPVIEEIITTTHAPDQLLSYEVIAGGCANLNIKFFLKNENRPFILRIYLRDADAAYKEQKIANLLKDIIRVPDVYYIGQYHEYNFAITEFMPGITLRDLLLSSKNYDLKLIMHQVGRTLAVISSFKFDHAGFFDKDLKIVKKISCHDYPQYALALLDEVNFISKLGSKLSSLIKEAIKRNEHYLVGLNEQHLVHGDFDPANILVDKIKGNWQVAAILDWEFALSGSILTDIANMLRYAHQMPRDFEKSFLAGLVSENIKLPSHWRRSINLLNLIALLDCLDRTDKKIMPNRYKDILSLIEHLLLELGKK